MLHLATRLGWGVIEWTGGEVDSGDRSRSGPNQAGEHGDTALGVRAVRELSALPET